MKVFLTFFIIALAAASVSANPFGGQEPQHQGDKAVFINKITDAQQTLRETIIKKTSEYRDSDSSAALIFFFSFLYGLVHAAGPGHNKAAVSAYTVSNKLSRYKAAAMGGLSGMFHGLTSIATVLIVYYLTKFSFGKTIQSTEKIFITVSSAGLFLFGIYLFFSSFKKETDAKKQNALFTLISGIIPCPATFIVLTFFISMDMTALGIACALFLTAGIMTTTSVTAVTVGEIGRHSYIFFNDRYKIISRLSALAISCFGILLYLTL